MGLGECAEVKTPRVGIESPCLDGEYFSIGV
jgi:hypothetical protein